jgi:hypothetical protein
MAGDYTKRRFNPLNDASGVLYQQGRVMLDQDWNELVDIFDRRLRAETVDIIGRAVVPNFTPDGFKIRTTTAGNDLTIGAGRIYVDGLLAENHGTDQLFDTVLEEMPGTHTLPQPGAPPVEQQPPLPFELQPYMPTHIAADGSHQVAWPFPATVPNPFILPTDGQPFLVYLDVWKREVTYLEAPELVDQAVGVDTATRTQTAWQVKVLPDVGAGTTCSTPGDQINGWTAVIARSAGLLTTSRGGVPSSTDPCTIPANTGYRGTDNRTYRVEIHTPGVPGVATQPPGAPPTPQVAQFKYSRNNASVASPVTAVDSSGTVLTVVRTKRDSALRFSPNDWVEVTDDIHEFAGQPGTMCQILSVDDTALTITLKAALPAGVYDTSDQQRPYRHTRVILWDQHGRVFDTQGNLISDVDANGGLINVPANATVVLEDGVQVSFSLDATVTNGQFQVGDYWLFAARVVDSSVEPLTNAPPRGIHHHFCRLAVVSFPSDVQNCLTYWPPDFGGQDCCTAVVGVGDDIQKAIDSLPREQGGCVCLKAGVHVISTPIRIDHYQNILIHGESIGAVIKNTASVKVLEISSSAAVAIESISFISTPQPNEFQQGTINVKSLVGCSVRDCRFSYSVSGQPTVPVACWIQDANQLEFRNNSVTGARVGVFASDPHDMIVVDNNFAGPTIVDPANNAIVSAGFNVVDLLRPAGTVTIRGNKITDFSTGVGILTNGSTGPGTAFPLELSIEDNLIRRHQLLASSSQSFGWDQAALGSLLQNKAYGIYTDAANAVISKNTVELADPGHGGILVFGPGVEVLDNSIESSIPAPTAFNWPSMPAGIIAYQQQPNSNVASVPRADHCRIVGNSLSGPQKGLAILAEVLDSIAVPLVAQNRIVSGVTSEVIDVTKPDTTLPTLQTSLQSLNNVFGILTINADRAEVSNNAVSKCTVGVAAITLEIAAQFLLPAGKTEVSTFVSQFSANLEGNTVDQTTIGIFLAGVVNSRVRDGVLNDSQLGIGLNQTKAVTVAGNECFNPKGVAHCVDLNSTQVHFKDNDVCGGQTGMLAFLTHDVVFEGNNVGLRGRPFSVSSITTTGTGIIVMSCSGEISIAGNDVFGCGQKGTSDIEAYLFSQIKHHLGDLEFGTAVAASIAVVECTGVATIEECEVRDTGQPSNAACIDICVFGGTGISHARIRACRIVRSAPMTSASFGIFAVPNYDSEDPHLTSLHVSGNHIAVPSFVVPVHLLSTFPSDTLFNDNLILQRTGPTAVSLTGDILVVTGNRIRAGGLDITSGTGLTCVGNIVSSTSTSPGITINGAVGLPDPSLSNVTA